MTKPLAFLFIFFAALSTARAAPGAGSSQLDEYRRVLTSLDTAKPESACTARSTLQTAMQVLSVGDRDELFRAFETFFANATVDTAPAFRKTMDSYDGDYQTWWEQQPTSSRTNLELAKAYVRARPEVWKSGSLWFRCGFTMAQSEGELYPATDSETLLAFASKLSPDLSSYVRFEAEEDREDVGSDATLHLTWEQLRRRIARWEAFASAHSTLPETKSEVLPVIQSLAKIYLLGTANTSIYGQTTGTLEPQLLQSWTAFVRNNQTSRFEPLIASLLKNANRQGQRLTQSDRPLFARYGMASDFDRWWQVNHRQQ